MIWLTNNYGSGVKNKEISLQWLGPVIIASSDSSDQGGDEATHGSEQVITRYKPKAKEPSMYKVLLLNDDYTPMDFVVLVLKRFFSKSEIEANELMMTVHNKGSAVAGLYSFEVAETKTYMVNQFARSSQHPLKCVMEKD